MTWRMCSSLTGKDSISLLQILYYFFTEGYFTCLFCHILKLEPNHHLLHFKIISSFGIYRYNNHKHFKNWHLRSTHIHISTNKIIRNYLKTVSLPKLIMGWTPTHQQLFINLLQATSVGQRVNTGFFLGVYTNILSLPAHMSKT